MLSNHWLRVRAFRSKVFFGQLLSGTWKPVQIIIHRSKRIRITWKETKERCLCWLVSHIGFPIISRKWVQSLRIYRSHLVAISQKPNQAWKCFDLEGTSCFLTVYKKSYKVSYLCIEIERRLLERFFNNVKAHILRPYFMQVNYLWLFLFFIFAAKFARLTWKQTPQTSPRKPEAFERQQQRKFFCHRSSGWASQQLIFGYFRSRAPSSNWWWKLQQVNKKVVR